MTHFARQIWKILDIIQKQVAICSKTMKDILVARRELCKELQYSIPDIAPEFEKSNTEYIKYVKHVFFSRFVT